QHRPTCLRSGLEFVEQARLANTGVGHNSDDLAVSGLSLLSCVIECFHLALAAYELGEASRGRALKVSTQGSESGYLKCFDRPTYPFHHSWAERLEGEVSLAESARSVSRRDRTDRR